MIEDQIVFGSQELKDSLPFGTIKLIAEAFGYKSAGGVGQMISGAKKANPLVIECSERIIEAYDASGFEDSLSKILKDYKDGN